MPRFAVIDVGTNSVKFNISERRPDNAWQTLLDRAEITRLGEGLEKTGEIRPDAMERTVSAIAGMVSQAREAGVAAISAVGTMGMRTAHNSQQFIDIVKQRCGVRIETIPGTEEGRLAYLAVKAGLGLGKGALAIFDTGGGSTQFTFGRGSSVEEQFSLNVGAVRFTEKYSLAGVVPQEQLRLAQDAIASEFSRIDKRPSPDALVVAGATFPPAAHQSRTLSDVTGTMGGFGLGRFSPRGWLVVTLIAPQHLLSERSGRSFAVIAIPVKSGGHLLVIC